MAKGIPLDLNLLRSFVTAAEQGSLSRAAVSLGFAQSALSRHLSALETEVGGRLFHRTGRGVQLTEIGQQMLPRAQGLLLEANNMLEEAQQVRTQPGGLVTLGMVFAWTQPMASRLSVWQRERFPGIQLRLMEGYSGRVEEWLGSGQIDVGVFNRYRTTGRGEPVLTSRMQLIMRSDDPRAMRPVRLQDLAGLPLALPARPNTLRVMLDTLCQRAGIELDVRLFTDSAVAIKDAIRDGGLYSVMPVQAISQERALGWLSGVNIEDPPIHQTTVIEATTRHPLSAAARQVWLALPALFRVEDGTPFMRHLR